MFLDQYTTWLRECPGATQLSINPTSDKGAYPYQWKIQSADGLRHFGYVYFDDEQILNGSDHQKKAHLRSELEKAIREAS